MKCRPKTFKVQFPQVISGLSFYVLCAAIELNCLNGLNNY